MFVSLETRRKAYWLLLGPLNQRKIGTLGGGATATNLIWAQGARANQRVRYKVSCVADTA